MSAVKITEGEVEFAVSTAGKGCKTWYKIFGDLRSAKHRPLVGLHGGPGVGHDYLIVLSDLTSLLGIPVVLYDQLGTGLSTHLPEKMGDATFWNDQLFLDELNNLLAHLGIQDDYDLLGHSWGGMLGSRHAVGQPKGLKHLVLSNTPADMGLWVEAQNTLRKQLPQDVQDMMAKHEAAGTTESEEYEGAVGVFYSQFMCRMNPMPEDLMAAFACIKRDPTVYMTLNGPSEFHITGTLKTWSVISDAHKITVPTLLLNGRYDEAQDSVMLPFFQEIPKVKWITFANSAHMPQHEERGKYMQVVSEFLTDYSRTGQAA